MYHELIDLWTAMIRRGLEEDGAHWDWTTRGTLHLKKDGEKQMEARLVAKSPGIFVGEGVAHAANLLGRQIGARMEIQSNLKDGESFTAGVALQSWKGDAALILAYERTLINLMAWLGGIATRTRGLVDLVQKACPQSPPRVTLTRKTLPYYREVSIHAVLAGGGFAHRPGLNSGVLIKENHIAAAGGITPALESCRAIAPHGMKLEVEVRDSAELNEALSAGADGVLLDNHTPEQVKEAVAVIQKKRPTCFVEVSGGLNEQTIGKYAIPGVHVLSVGGLTHSVSSVDLSLLAV